MTHWLAREGWTRHLLASSVVVTLALAPTASASGASAPLDRGGDSSRTGVEGAWDIYGGSCVATTCQVVGLALSATNGYAAASTDGGRHWTVERVPAAVVRLQDVSCGSPLDCVAVGAAASTAGLALVTTDGGRTWLLHMLPGHPQGVTSISCPTVSVCVGLAPHFHSGGVALVTQDGGATWTAHRLAPAVAQVGGLSCPTVNVCEGTAMPTSGNRTFALRTVNGGTTWSVRPLYPQAENYFANPFCPTASTCYAIGRTGTANNVMLKTVNGGASWRASPIALELEWAITCTSAASCVAIGATRTKVVALRTRNGGASWASAPIPGGLQQVWKVSCGTASTCVGVGDISTAPHSLAGVTIRTGNGSASWSVHSSL